MQVVRVRFFVILLGTMFLAPALMSPGDGWSGDQWDRAGARARWTQLDADRLASSVQQGAQSESPRGFQAGPLRLGAAKDITTPLGILLPIDLAVAEDGTIVIADSARNELVKADPSGDLIWRVGREGQGPGEFRHVYRVAVGQDGTVIALDLGTLEISWFDGGGTFIRRKTLSVMLRGIETIVLLDDGSVAVAGVALGAGLHSVRLFDAELRQIAAFGPLPQAQSDRALQWWGPGGFDLTEEGALLFTLKIPYEIYRFSPRGELHGLIQRPYSFEKGPDDFVVERRAGDRIGISLAPGFVPYPQTAQDLGDGWILGGVRTGPESVTWDLFHTDQLVASFPAPNAWHVPNGIDLKRGLMYIWTTDASDEYIQLQVPYVLETGGLSNVQAGGEEVVRNHTIQIGDSGSR